ncbi:small GTP-binding protein [Oscillochloris trichoides DG-6]|uniref:Small GTP-binding protein n=1 Tax=Oscillochloris trichoides DG-6 TaxID=765420 RepID=E1IAB2_9CHLR|nr:elongation factor G [Oscillochloris trichoides]EFO81866.1 small GTP-binding protein [Oscillochloris trichoides DG-6]
MRAYGPERIHNIGIFGHLGSGKTTLAEAMLMTAHAIPRMGRVEDGSTTSDYDPDEARRGMSVSLSVLPLEWHDDKVNLIDVPGFADFAGDMAATMRIIDGAVIVLDASGGVEVGTELAWEMAVQQKVPRLLFVNKLDRDNANFYRTIEQARELLDAAVIPMQIPIGTGKDFKGVISLRQQRAWLISPQHDGGFVEADVPAEMNDLMHEWRTALIDKIAATNDDLIERYLEGGEDALTREELLIGLRAGIADGTIVPVFCGSATEVTGIAQLLNGIVDSIPSAARKPVPATDLTTGEETTLRAASDEQLSALVFKTVSDTYGRVSYFRVYSGEVRANSSALNSRTRKEERIAHVYTVRGKEQTEVEAIGAGDIGVVTKLTETATNDTLCAAGHPLQLAPITFPAASFIATVKPHSRADLDKLGVALGRMIEEDPTLRTNRDSQTGETLLSGLGESHLAIVADRMKRKFDVSIDIELPRIPYRESIRGRAEAQYRHKKQTGGAGQFADVTLRVEALAPDPAREDPLEFVNEIVGGVISRGFMPAIEKGVREAMAEGLLSGSPLIDVRVAVIDGKEHPVDSKEIAFKSAGKEAFKLAAAKARPAITEPIYQLEIIVPDQFAGDIMSDMSTRRGRVQGMLPTGTGKTVITAQAPLAEIQRYATDLKGMTQGRGRFSMTFIHYDDVPVQLVDAIIAAHKKEVEAAH